MKEERIGFAFCGSFCTHKKVLEQYLLLTQEYETVYQKALPQRIPVSGAPQIF